MMSNVLQQIVEHKRSEVEQRKLITPLQSFIQKLSPSQRSLQEALSNEHADFILECKKASPSKGLIRKDFDLSYILNQYAQFASAISVLTDKKYFQGDFSYLQQASQQVSLPIICKDFFIDTYQVFEARRHGADAILLMLSVLNDQQYQELAEVAEQLNLDILTEVHDETELARAVNLNAKIIGINNRNLKDLSIDLATTEKLAKLAPKNSIVISESGISTHADVKRLSPIVNGFLVGSSIMSQLDIRAHCKALIFGQTKICGITRIEDAQLIDELGAIYAGFIFYPKSKRFISLTKAQIIVAAVELKYVGVFVNEEIEAIITHAKSLDLYAIQLHGDEDSTYIAKLSKALPQVQIWKAVRILDSIDFEQDSNVDYFLLDSYSAKEQGGSGTRFDWRLLGSLSPHNLIIAGGINTENLAQAKALNTFAIDISSGVEYSPGIKDADKLTQIFKQLRA